MKMCFCLPIAHLLLLSFLFFSAFLFVAERQNGLVRACGRAMPKLVSGAGGAASRGVDGRSRTARIAPAGFIAKDAIRSDTALVAG